MNNVVHVSFRGIAVIQLRAAWQGITVRVTDEAAANQFRSATKGALPSHEVRKISLGGWFSRALGPTGVNIVRNPVTVQSA